MDENEAQGNEKSEAGPDGYTIVTLSDAQAQQVMDFIAELKKDEDDVGGYMINRSLFGGFSGINSEAGTATNTNATTYWTGTPLPAHWDSTVGDSDMTN